MLKSERQAYIVRQENFHKKILLTDLSEQMDVSNDTIRRDLQELAEMGKVIKIYGGALSLLSLRTSGTQRSLPLHTEQDHSKKGRIAYKKGHVYINGQRNNDQ